MNLERKLNYYLFMGSFVSLKEISQVVFVSILTNVTKSTYKKNKAFEINGLGIMMNFQ